MIAEDFPPDNHTGYTFANESAGDIIRKLFEEKEEEIDLDEVLEGKIDSLMRRLETMEVENREA